MDAATGWLVFVSLALLLALAGPVLAALLRRGLAPRRREPVPLPPVSFGASERTRPSPRHAIRLHRTLMSVLFVALVGLCLLPALVALRSLGAAALPAALAFVLPTLVVMTHARRRSGLR